MKTLIERACFGYGCAMSLATLGWLAWQLVNPSWAWLAALPESFVVMSTLHVFVLAVTFQRFSFRKPFWQPVIRVNTFRTQAARVTIAALFIALVALVVIVMIIAPHARARTQESLFGFVVVGLAVVSSIYISFHWALRPENIFSPRFLYVASSPLLYLWRRGTRR